MVTSLSKIALTVLSCLLLLTPVARTATHVSSDTLDQQEYAEKEAFIQEIVKLMESLEEVGEKERAEAEADIQRSVKDFYILKRLEEQTEKTASEE